MAADFGVYFATDRLPSIAEWEQSAADLGVRLRITPVDLREHSGVLPVAFEADDFNSGFEFQLTTGWGRDPRAAELLAGKDLFAHFRCFSDEFPAAVWAAVSFARATDGVFQDTSGVNFPDLEAAIAFAREVSETSVQGPEFFLDGEPVGMFTGAGMPRTPGEYRFTPHQGAGYYRMMDLLWEDSLPRCYCEGPDGRVWFTIKGRPYSDVLELDDFEAR